MEVSFGMIFSIILIIAFIVTAGIVIYPFLKNTKCSEVGLFKTDLQSEINTAYHSDAMTTIFPKTATTDVKEITEICFADFNKPANNHQEEFELRKLNGVDKNMFFLPEGIACAGQESYKIPEINISIITAERNPYCIGRRAGNFKVTIEKKFSSVLVEIL